MTDRIIELDVSLLQALDALLKDPNVTRAATRLNITQSALSARLIRLRQVLNDPLFIPAASGRGMVPTPHAMALQPDLEALLERLSDFARGATLLDPSTSQRIFRIAATDNPAAILAPDLIPLIRSQAPQTRVAFTLPDKARIPELLEDGQLDLFVGAAEDGGRDAVARPLYREEFVTAQRKGHPRGTGPLTLDAFCALDHLLVSTSGDRFTGMIDDALADLGRERRVSVSIQSYALTPLVLSGSDLICTLPRRFLARFAADLDLFTPPLEYPPSRSSCSGTRACGAIRPMPGCAAKSTTARRRPWRRTDTGTPQGAKPASLFGRLSVRPCVSGRCTGRRC